MKPEQASKPEVSVSMAWFQDLEDNGIIVITDETELRIEIGKVIARRLKNG